MPLPVVGGMTSIEIADLGGGGQTSQEHDAVLLGLGCKADAPTFWRMLAVPSTGGASMFLYASSSSMLALWVRKAQQAIMKVIWFPDDIIAC